MTYDPGRYQYPHAGQAPAPQGYAPQGYYSPQGFYAFPGQPGYGQPVKHSGAGVASFAVGLIAGFSELLLVAIAVMMAAESAGGLDENSPQARALRAPTCIALIINLVGVGLGIGGVIQRTRKRVFAVLGLILNGGTLLFLFLVAVAGMSAE